MVNVCVELGWWVRVSSLLCGFEKGEKFCVEL